MACVHGSKRQSALAVGFHSTAYLQDKPGLQKESLAALNKTFATKVPTPPQLLNGDVRNGLLTLQLVWKESEKGPVEWVGLKEARSRILKLGLTELSVLVITTSPRFAALWWVGKRTGLKSEADGEGLQGKLVALGRGREGEERVSVGAGLGLHPSSPQQLASPHSLSPP